MTARRPVVAAFDVDRTVTTRDCVVPFLRRVAGTFPFAARMMLASARILPAVARGDRDRAKEDAVRIVFRGRRAVDVQAAGEAFATVVARSWLRPDTVARLRWHQESEHEVVLVSASFTAYLQPLARHLGVDGVLATELAVDDHGLLTGALSGANCRGVEKVHRLHAWLQERHGDRANVEVWAYGDSPGDRELLADADHAVLGARRDAAGPGGSAVTDSAFGRESSYRALVRTARPKQWAKNVLVFAAPGAAGVLDDWPELGYTLLVFVAFCLAASGIYCWNDALDVDADRRHPTKRFRPVASGEVSVDAAKVAGTVLVVAALVVAAGTGRWQTVAVVGVYVAVTLAYTFWLKHIAVLDIATIAAGFLLRAAGGAVAVDVEMSQWFVLCTVFGSLFIVVGKRYAELLEMGEDGPTVRTTLGEYSAGYLRIVLTLSCGAALVSYCLWAFETKEISGSELPFYELSIVPMIIALLRYLLVLEQGRGAAPEEVFASDRVLQVTGAVWVVVFGLGVYLA